MTFSLRQRWLCSIPKVCRHWVILWVLVLWAASAATADSGEKVGPLEVAPGQGPPEAGRRDWYYFVAAVNVYPRLESEDLVHDLLDPVLGALSPGHRGVGTIGDLRDDHLLWPPHLGLGVNLNRHWSLFVEAGYTSGKVRTKVDRPSILLLPLHTDFEIQRSALFAGVGLDYYPWEMPVQRDYKGVWPRLAAARPFLGTRFTWTYATYNAKVKVGFHPFPNLVNLELSDAWSLPSFTVVGGVDIPLTERTSLTLNGGYNNFWKQEFDFEGYAFTVQVRRYIGGPGHSPERRKERSMP